MSKKIVITGVAGFVGSHIAETALAKGYEVIGIDNYSSGVNYTPSDVNFHSRDINDNLKDIMKGADAVIHAAAYAELRHNWSNIEERKRLFFNNEMGTISILEQMPDVPMIFLSSASVYGSLSHEKITNRPLVEEDVTPTSIESPYAASKLACEAYVAAWSFKRQTPWHVLRLVNQVGDRTHRGVITDFLRMIKDKKHIHAADNGKQTKNWVAVQDTANTAIRMLDGQNPVPSGIYTVASAEKWSWRDIVDVMLKMYAEKHPDAPPPFELTFEDKVAGAIGDPVNLHVSNAKLNEYYKCNYPIIDAVKAALNHLKWPE